VRALGQPLIMTPLTAAAFEGISGPDVGSASTLYNMLRNLGGSIGISMLATLQANRYQLHFARITESVRQTLPAVTAQLSRPGALQHLAQAINREAVVMAFADCFLAMAVTMVFASAGVVLMRKSHAQGAPAGAH
jgi:DHA2 family multidrug resistance protein